MAKNWDPGVRKFFLRIINSVSLVLLWMMVSFTAGLYYELAYTNGKPLIYTVLFYAVMLISLFFLIRYLIKTWKKVEEQ